MAGGGGGQYAAPTHHVRVDKVAVGEGDAHHAGGVAQGEGDELLVGECDFGEAGVFAAAAVGEAYDVAAGSCCVGDPLPLGGGVGECLGADGGCFFGDEQAGAARVLVQIGCVNDEGDESDFGAGFQGG